jgi:hypothetical protein
MRKMEAGHMAGVAKKRNMYRILENGDSLDTEKK